MSINITYCRDAHVDVPFQVFERIQHWEMMDTRTLGTARCHAATLRGELHHFTSEVDIRDQESARFVSREVLPLLVSGVNDIHFHPDPEWHSALPVASAPKLTDSTMFGGGGDV